MLGINPIPKSTETTDHRSLSEIIKSIKEEMDDNELLSHLKSVTKSINKSSDNKTRNLDPSPSSAPTGTEWTLDAMIQNIKSVLNINSSTANTVKEFSSLPISSQIALLKSIVEKLLVKNAPKNDRNNTFESVMNILGELGPEYSDLILYVTQPLLDTFYNDIKKPYINYVGNKFRTADGSENSIGFPSTGKAGSNYVRSVTSNRLNNTNLPSPKDVFHKVLKRPDGVFNPHKEGINMFLFYLAIIISHDLFYTDSSNPMRNLTTSYLDLSVLYGFNRTDQESIRQMKDGLLKPDQWFDKRLVIQPSGVAGLMIVFSRNHNHIAQQLLKINENGRFNVGPNQPLKTAKALDEELFQTARLINNGCFINIIIHDYIRTIIGTDADSDFILDPFSTPSDPIYGNAVSIEFNMVYRWHSAIGQDDSEWLDQMMKLLMGQMSTETSVAGKDRDLINKGAQEGSLFDKILVGFNQYFVQADQEELTRGLPVAGLHRQEDGTFLDSDILNVLRKGYEQTASEVGNGLNTPAALEHVEIAGIQQARYLNVCTFNEFRSFLNLTTMNTFEDFSEKKEVQDGLKELYGTPDNVELYTGLMVERSKQTGLRLPYTMGRAILSDAVNLLKNDRILTKEMTPGTLTNWGYTYTKGDPNSNNRIFPTLLSTLFPNATPETGAFTKEELRNLFKAPK